MIIIKMMEDIQNKYKSVLDCSFIKKEDKFLMGLILDESLKYIKTKYDHYNKDIKTASVFSVILLMKNYTKFSINDVLYYIDCFFDYHDKNYVEYKKSVELLSTDFMFEFEITFYRNFVDFFIKKN
jgi:hypothetical protein